jgi:uncharacterized protein (DUF362 family)
MLAPAARVDKLSDAARAFDKLSGCHGSFRLVGFLHPVRQQGVRAAEVVGDVRARWLQNAGTFMSRGIRLRGEETMDRREFLKQVAAWSAGMTAAGPLFRMTRTALAAEGVPKTVPTLALGTGTDYGKLIDRLLQALGGMKKFVRAGAKVVVKPNIGWDRNPAQGADTHPQVVKALVKQALDAGASKVLVFDRTCNDNRRCYANSGIAEAVESVGDRRAAWEYIDDRKFVPVKIEKGVSLTEWQFYKDALDADCYVNVPVAKHHGLSRLTLGMKNVMGVIGGRRGEIHSSIGQRLADLNTVVRPTLTVIDATRILLRNGPGGGNLADVKTLDTLLASADPVAADAYATTLFDLKPEEISSTCAAYKAGLGEMDLQKVRVLRV